MTGPMNDTDTLIDSVRDGSPLAFEELFNRYRGRLQKTIAHKLFLAGILILTCIGSSAQTVDGTATLNDKNDILRIPQDTSIVLSFSGKLNGKKNLAPPHITAAQALVVDGVTVIAAGSPVQFGIRREPPRRMLRNGYVGFDVFSVTAVSGEEIPLTASYTSRGNASCNEACVPLFFLLPFIYGGSGSINTEMLLKATFTAEVHLNRKKIPDRTQKEAVTEVASLPARIHFYGNGVTPDDRLPYGFYGNGITPDEHVPYGMQDSIILDGKKIGSLDYSEYSCISVSPGLHRVKVGKSILILDAEPGKEGYVRITDSFQKNGYESDIPKHQPILEQTEGYEFDSGPLKLGKYIKGKVPCFVPMTELPKKGPDSQTKPGRRPKRYTHPLANGDIQ
jgi:hypothetical protein